MHRDRDTLNATWTHVVLATTTEVLFTAAVYQDSSFSRWLPTAAARVRARVWSSGICGGQNGAGAGFL
jgi:hypothetical protein